MAASAAYAENVLMVHESPGLLNIADLWDWQEATNTATLVQPTEIVQMQRQVMMCGAYRKPNESNKSTSE
jgi:hypothetical protein